MGTIFSLVGHGAVEHTEEPETHWDMTKTENEGLSFWKENEPWVRKLRLKYLDRETVIEAMKFYHQEVQKNIF